MLFNSFAFLCFLPAVLALYFLLPHKAQNRMLLAASLFFYACWDWRFLAPLLFSTSIDYYCALRMEQSFARNDPPAVRRRYLVLSLVTNLGLLAFFKYCNFFAENFIALLRLAGLSTPAWTIEIILPVGISFYTFQALSYTIDVYRGQLHATVRFADFLLAVLYFPHLVAGPIQRAASLLPQVTQPRSVTRQQWIDGIHLIVWGLFKKTFIADNLAPEVNRIFAHPSAPGFEVWMACVAFAVQIYCDFSGYTDIARGTAKLMGFEFVLNFNLPYISRTPQEFWSRWHISLSTWLRDYLYIPLGGNRGGEFRTRRNLLLTMVIGGLWHGASWNFVLWGLFHGLLLVSYRACETQRLAFEKQLHGLRRTAWWAATWAVMMAFTIYGWLLFRAVSLDQIAAFTLAMASPFEGWSGELLHRVAVYSAPLLVVQALQAITGRLDFLSFRWLPVEVRAACYAGMAYAALFSGGQSQAFIYFQF